ncbi:hypothetical protein GCM10009550_37200 [Actinocorallia libanotica]|uniref:Peptidase S1 domain-containing protein n=2 Tax=Actinocorallia libanotica TaxID=46162 RepID=A0ABP4BS87_9ACTN
MFSKAAIVGGRGYTRMELQQEADRAASRIPAGVSAMVAPDVRTGEILVRAQQSRSVKSSAELRPEPAANPRIKFRVELVSDTPVRQVDGWLRGGGLLDLKDGGSLCTIGFNIHKDGMRSPSTAGHCAKSTEARRYANHSGDGGSTEIQRKLYYEGPEGDFARYGPGTMTSTDTYYYDWNQKRYVDQVATYAMTNEPGKTLCKFGRASGAVCGTVNSVGVSYVNPGGVTVGRQVYMNGGACIGGDSGGPFYWGGNAYGLTSATSNGNCWFSQARFIPNALNGWQVVTR